MKRVAVEQHTLPDSFIGTLSHFRMGQLKFDHSRINDSFDFPVCIIWGSDDGTCPSQGAEELKKIIKRAQIHVLAGKHFHTWNLDKDKQIERFC